MLNTAEIRLLAVRFRTALQVTDKDILPVGVQSFPRGSCGDVSILLAAYLADHGAGDFDYVCAERGVHVEDGSEDDWTTHAWVQRGDLIVDITADQFAEMVEVPVIVSTDSAWHRGFSVRERHPQADFRYYDPRTQAMLGGTYARLRRTADQVP